MEKKHYVLYLNPPRPTFIMDITAEERGIMQRHKEYWTENMNKGKVIVFGPVMEPATVYGLGIVEVETEAELADFIANDPSNGLNTFEFYPIRAVVPER